MSDLKQFGKVVLFFVYIFMLIACVAGCFNWAAQPEEHFYWIPGLVVLGINGYGLYKIGKSLFFQDK